MSITAKEIANALGLSPSAVSLALNNKPGVSEETKNTVLEYAEKHGFVFKKYDMSQNKKLNILFIIHQEYSLALDYHNISLEMLDGISEVCQNHHCILNSQTIKSDEDSIRNCIENLRLNPVDGILILGTSIQKETVKRFLSLNIPLVLLDSSLDSVDCSRICINNIQGSYHATDYLIQMRHSQPGYLCSNIRLNNFEERRLGFKEALHDHGLSYSRSIIHELSPSIDGAFADFMEILEQNQDLADCYFADNDLIAIGVIRALQTKGINVPEDVGIIGFDNINLCRILQPSLSSIAFSRKYLGQLAIYQLLYHIQNPNQPHIKIAIDTKLIKRFSI